MNRNTAKRVREDYKRKMSVALICEKYGITPSCAYEVIANQRFHDEGYVPPARPKDVLDSIGVYEISQKRNEGCSWRRISQLIQEDTGKFVSANSIRRWYQCA